MITKDLVNNLFEYKDGELYWKVATGSRAVVGKMAGSLNHDGYKRIKINNKLYSTHRLIFLMFNGYLPECVDHIDGNPSNNIIENLRQATKAQNCLNSKLLNRNKSGIKGVSWNKQKKAWVVQLMVNNAKKYFGHYHDIAVAKFVADAMRYKYHKEFARFA